MLNNYGSILSATDMIDGAVEKALENTRDVKTARTNDYTSLSNSIDDMLSKHFDGSTRLIGAPHQLLAHNDRRYGKSRLGRMYGEKILMEAPIVCIKPGVSEFLPGKNSKEKTAFINAIGEIMKGDKQPFIDKLNNEGNDMIQYFGIKSDYNGYMSKVNMLCRILATFLGIQDVKVPWDTTSNFASYDWRGYRMQSELGDLNKHNSESVFSAFKDFMSSASDAFTKDYEYIHFYVNPNVSYSESYSNNTTSSVLESTTEQLQGLAKELQVVSAITDVDITGVADSAVSSLSSFIEENKKNNGAISTMLSKITGASKQVLNGGNFVLPEIWNSSSSSNSYSFEMHLVTPYGNTLAWYINVGVPMMFCIALALPIQQTANVVASPYLIQAFCPGWWNCYMGIMDSMSIEKGGDGTFNKAGLPNEVTIRFSLKDLYSQLALPQSTDPLQFMSNTGMLNFLMVNAGLDISNQKLGDKFDIWKMLFQNRVDKFIESKKYNLLMQFKHGATELFKIL